MPIRLGQPRPLVEPGACEKSQSPRNVAPAAREVASGKDVRNRRVPDSFSAGNRRNTSPSSGGDTRTRRCPVGIAFDRQAVDELGDDLS